MRCHLCLELPAHDATSVVLLSVDTDQPYIMRLCPRHLVDYRDRNDATVVDVPSASAPMVTVPLTPV